MVVPKNKLFGIFFLGSFISPAIKVTLFQASEEKSELIIVAPNAPIKAKPDRGITSHSPLGNFTVLYASHMCSKFCEKTSVFKPIANPKIINAKRANNFAEVKII